MILLLAFVPSDGREDELKCTIISTHLIIPSSQYTSALNMRSSLTTVPPLTSSFILAVYGNRKNKSKCRNSNSIALLDKSYCNKTQTTTREVCYNLHVSGYFIIKRKKQYHLDFTAQRQSSGSLRCWVQ